jgi:thiol:disulfide interchange protein
MAIFRPTFVLVALLAAIGASPVAAADGPPPQFRGNHAVTARLILNGDTLTTGGTTTATVELTPAAGWHLYGPEHGDAGAPPSVAWSLPRGLHAGPIAFPPARRVVTQGLTTFNYDGRTALRIPISAADATPLGRARIVAHVTWLVCSNVCVPGGATLASTLDVTPPAVGATFASIAPFIALAFVGGLILNVMPCVFTVLSFKALRVIGEPAGERRWSAVAYTAGVMLSCAFLGAVLIAARAAGATFGWGFQLQSPVFVGFLAALLVALALAMSGVYELTLPIPQAFARRAAAAGAFGDGVLITLIASACIAPYMGAALGFALSAKPPVAIGVFIALGLGLALPQALLIATPALLRWVPKPGRWMLVARRVLALPLYLSAAWLVWVFVQQVTPTPQGTITAGVRNDNGFSATRLAELRREHHAVLVDVSAAWCVTCEVNERLALDRPAVSRRLSDLNVTVLRADWTRQDPQITAYLRSLGSAGVPLYVYYGANGNVDVWPQVLTQQTIIDRLKLE